MKNKIYTYISLVGLIVPTIFVPAMNVQANENKPYVNQINKKLLF